MNEFIKPTPEQIKWADCELGVILHLDIQLFEPSFRFRKKWGYTPSPEIFNPKELNTDQWLEVAKDIGAKYAILVVNHCSGFCLWPSQVSDYTIKETPYKNGNGDIFYEFIASCKKFNILPGVYYSTICNAHSLYDQPSNRILAPDSNEFKNYCELVEAQLTELWTQYGELFEIWFDGGHIPNGPSIPELLKKYQPHAVCFQGPKGWHSNLRWVGNERGIAPNPCWSTINDYGHYDGTKAIKDINKGDPDGKIWMPAETDTPNRFLQWFWYKNQKSLVKPVEELIRVYYNSVGRNTNLLLGMVINDKGLVPKLDAEVFRQFGTEIKLRFENPIAETQGTANELVLELPKEQIINQIVIMEDISEGHIIRKYQLDGFQNNKWSTLCEGSCIGHKAIHIFKPIEVSKIRLRCSIKINIPKIKKLNVYNVKPLLKKPGVFKRIVRWIKVLKKLKTIVL